MTYQLKSIASKTKYLREAASVRRCHTVPHVGEYSVGHHTFNMLAMLRLLRPLAPIQLVWAIVEHDVPERLTGDIPAPTKWFGAVDKSVLNDLENKITVCLLDIEHTSILTPEDQSWLRGLDIIELYLFTRDQMSLGNVQIQRMKLRIEDYISKNAHTYPIELLDFYHECKNHDWSMMPDLGENE